MHAYSERDIKLLLSIVKTCYENNGFPYFNRNEKKRKEFNFRKRLEVILSLYYFNGFVFFVSVYIQ